MHPIPKDAPDWQTAYQREQERSMEWYRYTQTTEGKRTLALLESMAYKAALSHKTKEFRHIPALAGEIESR